jgi:hypothetical protein
MRADDAEPATRKRAIQDIVKALRDAGEIARRVARERR